jgi:hypothetical protein
MAAFLDNCRFIATAAGTGDFSFASPAGGCQSPVAAGAVNGVKYKLRAESADLTQWEIFEGAYSATTGTFTRTTVLYNSSGTGAASGQSGAGSKIDFTVVPQVAVIGLAEDLISIEVTNSFSSTQQAQARTNIGAAASLRTRHVLTSGSGTYAPPPGCQAINVRMVGGGGGGGGSSNANSGGGGSNGNNTSFGTSLLVAGGGIGVGNATQGGPGGTATGGDINLAGGCGQGSSIAGGGPMGGQGGASAFGGNGIGGAAGNPGGAGAAGTGGGGGGGGGTASAGWSAGGAGSGAYCEKLIVGPNSTYPYSIGAGGSAGGAGTGGWNGGAGGSGIIIIDEYY